MKLEIIDKDKSRHKDLSWVIVRKRTEDINYHSVMYMGCDISEIGNEIDLPNELSIAVTWEVSGKLNDDNSVVDFDSSTVGGYSLNSELKFGLYRGFELGIVYAFDISYVSWLIKNVDGFMIKNLCNLEKIGVFRGEKRILPSRIYGCAEDDLFMSEFKSLQGLARRINFLNTEIRLSDEVKELNNRKLDGIS